MGDIKLDNEKAIIEQQLHSILNSEQFENAPAVRAFLEYVVKETIAGRSHTLKAYTIAVEVFGRSIRFDPTNDTIVRTTAGRVRKALEAYYHACDAVPLVIINLPKGRYVPSFDLQVGIPPPCQVTRRRAFLILDFFWNSRKAAFPLILAVVAFCVVPLFNWEFLFRSPQNVIVIDVRPVHDVGEHSHHLAKEIDTRLAAALSRIDLAEIISSSSSRLEGGSGSAIRPYNSFHFTLKSSIVGTPEDGELLSELVNTGSKHILWASRERLSGTDSPDIAKLVDKIAFQVLGNGGAVSASMNKLNSNIRSRPKCLFRAQIMEVIENHDSFVQLRDCLENIVAASPADPAPWAILSNFYTLRSHFYSAGSRDERARLVELAEHAAEKAVELAPQSYLTKVALMHLSLRQGRIQEFEALEREIRTTFPGDIYLQIRIATRIARLGRGHEALVIFEKAQREFGINLKNWAPGIAVAYFAEGEYEKAHLEMLRTTSNLPFVLVLRAAILGKLNRADEAVPLVQRLINNSPDMRNTFYSWLMDVGWSKSLVLDIADGLSAVGFVVGTASTNR